MATNEICLCSDPEEYLEIAKLGATYSNNTHLLKLYECYRLRQRPVPDHPAALNEALKAAGLLKQ